MTVQTKLSDKGKIKVTTYSSVKKYFIVKAAFQSLDFESIHIYQNQLIFINACCRGKNTEESVYDALKEAW